MPYLQPLKIQKESYAVSSTISCYLNPSGHRKITRLTIFAVSDPSSSSSSSSSKNNSPAAYSKQFLTENSSKSGKSSYGAFFVQKESTYTHDGDVNKTNGKETSKGPITIMAKRFSAKRRPFWRKLLFGSKKFRSIILLNIVTIVYGMFFNIPLLLITYLCVVLNDRNVFDMCSKQHSCCKRSRNNDGSCSFLCSEVHCFSHTVLAICF